MALVPLSYTYRSIIGRSSATALTIVGTGATVAVLAGVLALQQGFQTLFAQGGRDDVAMFLRKGATSEGESSYPVDRAEIVKKSTPEIALDAAGRPLASGEMYLAVRRRKLDGGETNVPIRGIEQASIAIHGDALRIVEGRWLEPGKNEVCVGRSLTTRIQDAQVGQQLRINTMSFQVVGVFDHDGPYASEIWGDAQVMSQVLERPGFNRILATLKPGTDVAALTQRLDGDKQVPSKVLTERAYLEGQTQGLSFVLIGLGTFLAIIMGTAAVLTGTNTMLAALASRTHEVGILLAIGFRPHSIFLSFMLESVFLGLLGGVVGCLMILPVNGVRTGTTNFQTFTEVAFAFRVTPLVLGVAVGFSLVLGVLAGTLPALFAAMLRPTQALRRE